MWGNSLWGDGEGVCVVGEGGEEAGVDASSTCCVLNADAQYFKDSHYYYYI